MAERQSDCGHPCKHASPSACDYPLVLSRFQQMWLKKDGKEVEGGHIVVELTDHGVRASVRKGPR